MHACIQVSIKLTLMHLAQLIQVIVVVQCCAALRLGAAALRLGAGLRLGAALCTGAALHLGAASIVSHRSRHCWPRARASVLALRFLSWHLLRLRSIIFAVLQCFALFARLHLLQMPGGSPFAAAVGLAAAYCFGAVFFPREWRQHSRLPEKVQDARRPQLGSWLFTIPYPSFPILLFPMGLFIGVLRWSFPLNFRIT